jgi:hypothetical protein
MQGLKFTVSPARLENRETVIADIEKAQPTRVLNCAGVTGRPNVDWCEDHKVCQPVHSTLKLSCFVALQYASQYIVVQDA